MYNRQGIRVSLCYNGMLDHTTVLSGKCGLYSDSLDFNDNIDDRQGDVESVEEYRPSARYAVIVERNKDERDAEQADESNRGHP
jgi:hypothetical protein